MAAHMEANPAARAVVNFTPVLLEQLEEIVASRRRAPAHRQPAAGSRCSALLGPDPVPAEPAERLELLRACLRAQRKQMIERFGPYLELATLAEPLATLERVSYASDQLIHDLAVWYHLAWLGETVRRSDTLREQPDPTGPRVHGRAAARAAGPGRAISSPPSFRAIGGSPSAGSASCR